jgi:uncharacterized protein
MRLSRYVKCYPYPEEPGYVLLFSTRTTAAVLVEESVLRAAKDGTLDPEDAETLAAHGLVVDDLKREKDEACSTFDRVNRERRKFAPVVVMNLDCNLACRYCFEGTLKGRRYMSRETARDVIEMARRRLLDGMSVEIDFYGGEPLLSYDLITEISGKVQTMAEEAGSSYLCALITNGTLLTRKRAEELAAVGLRAATVTLDGPEEIHNAFRPYRSGAGSFADIVRNIRDVCEMVEIRIGGNYMRDNYREFPSMLDDLIEEGITPDRLSTVQFNPVSQPRGVYALPEFRGGCVSSSEPWVHEAAVFLREEILKRGFRTVPVSPTVCMIESDHDLVINFDGSLYKCPGLIGLEGYDVGTIREGVRDYRKSHNLDVWKTQECLECVYLPLCFGGCRNETLLRNGSIDAVDCRKELYDATLEQSVRQDLRYLSNAER